MNALYGDRADLYDKVYAWRDYAGDTQQIAAALARLDVPAPARVLEGACGTGTFLPLLREGGFAADGFDLSPEMVDRAREKAPDARVWAADLRSFEVDGRYDAFLCLFGSIGYLMGTDALGACARAAARAVRPGGAILVEPWFPIGVFTPGAPGMDTWDEPDLKVARVMVSELEGEDVAVLPMRFVVARRGRPIETFEDVHRLWCAPTQVLLDAFGAAGFDVAHDPEGLGPYRDAILGRRRAGQERG